MATALAKARQVHGALGQARSSPALVLGADTIVVDGRGQVIEKPMDRADARRMLTQLAGTWHEVYTGVALVGEGAGERTFYERTRVCFAALSPELLDYYLDHDSYG
jgi:septum formation protein